MKLNTNTTLIVVAAIALVGGGYWYFFTGGTNAAGDLPLSTTDAASPAEVKFQTLVSELAPITFDTGIFKDARFNALVDLKTPVSPEAPGRLDPFAPIAGVSSLPE